MPTVFSCIKYWNFEFESLVIVENAENKLNEVQEESGVIIKNKLNYVLGKNIGFKKLKLLGLFFKIQIKICQMRLNQHYLAYVV